MTDDFQPTMPFDRLRERIREQQDRDWAEINRRMRPSGLDQQGRYPTRQIQFTDSDMDHSTADGRIIGIYLCIASALCVIALAAVLAL
jgi:hypothetical protein